MRNSKSYEWLTMRKKCLPSVGRHVYRRIERTVRPPRTGSHTRGEAGRVDEIEREALLAMVQTDSELSDIFLRAFILRRLELIARGIGDLILIGRAIHSIRSE
jgi:hypothetical protein